MQQKADRVMRANLGLVGKICRDRTSLRQVNDVQPICKWSSAARRPTAVSSVDLQYQRKHERVRWLKVNCVVSMVAAC